MTKIKGQITNEQFKAEYPKAIVNYRKGTATTKSGKTTNYWIQHEDTSWTNWNCKTKY